MKRTTVTKDVQVEELKEIFNGRIFRQLERALTPPELMLSVSNCTVDMLQLVRILQEHKPGPTIKAVADLMRAKIPDVPELTDKLEHMGKVTATIALYGKWFDDFFRANADKVASFKTVNCPCPTCVEERAVVTEPGSQSLCV